ncbi:unnamed protein product, partial [Ilex paraguariensis]
EKHVRVKENQEAVVVIFDKSTQFQTLECEERHWLEYTCSSAKEVGGSLWLQMRRMS